MHRARAFAAGLAGLLSPVLVCAQLVGIAVDPRVQWNAGKVSPRVQPGVEGRVVFLDYRGAQATPAGSVVAPTNYYGPPSSVVVSADRTLAAVSASMKVDPADAGKFQPDRALTLIDLKGAAPRVAQSVTLPAPAVSLALSPSGRTLLAVHLNDDSLSVYSIADQQARFVERVSLGVGAQPYAAAFSPDGRKLLVSQGGDHKLAVFAVEGDRIVQPAVRKLVTGVRPFAVSWCGASGLAVVSNMGGGGEDHDSVNLVDTTLNPPRIVHTVSVDPSPEGVACAPDGRHAAAASQNGSNKVPGSAFHNASSKLVLYRIEGRQLVRVADAPFGAWSQGVIFLDDSRTVLAQSVLDRSVHAWSIEGDRLQPLGARVIEEGPPVAFGPAGR